MNPLYGEGITVPGDHVCMHPNCRMPIFESQMLCSLHASGHRPRQAAEDEPGDE